MEAIRFESIRKFCAITDRVSICDKETHCYENYETIEQVPGTYDDKYLYGFGIIESEFDDTIKQCMEIMVSDTPREEQSSFCYEVY